MPDNNWFFSTLAQCTAALIGMLGGMLITKLMDYRDSYNLAESKRYLDKQLGNWRHNVLATILNAGRREIEEKDKKILQEIHRLAEQEKPYTSVKSYRLFCNELLQKSSLLQLQPVSARPDSLDKELNKYLVMKKDEIIILWEYHNARLYPKSIYAMFVMLVALGGAGIIGPLTFLAGFHPVLFWFFLTGFILLCLCVLWFLVDLAKTNRIQPEQDPNLLPYLKTASGGIMPTVESF